MATITDLRNTRIEKLNELKKLGVDAYPPKSLKDTANGEIKDNFAKLEGKEVTVAGRITSIRSYKDLAFFDIKDSTGKIQLYIKRDLLKVPNYKNSELSFDDLKNLDVGDFVETFGKVTKTKTGEISVEATTVRILSKSVRPLPDKWEGFKDIEERYRRRYVDFLINDDAKKIIDARWTIEKEIRKFLWSKGFDEVETPILQPLYGGTNAKPFSTHFNALDWDFYLRVAPELYLKRLMVGGYDKVFEIARNFRNEGIDHSHFPEFTMLEWYEAYADYHRVMDLAEEMTKHLVKSLTGGTVLKVKGKEIDIGKKWQRVAVEDLLEKHLGIKWDKVTDAEAKKLAEKYKINVRGTWDKNKLLFNLYDSEITPKLEDPTWVIDYPTAVSPLSHAHRTKPGRAERFEGYIGGVEIFDGWSEIVSGLEQRERFEKEQKNMKEGDTEAMPLDEDFIETLEYGCPPLGGIGFGIDRLVMFLTDTWAIKDVVAFPTLKPKN
jgi:lysyl-tRNA synthetase, class II